AFLQIASKLHCTSRFSRRLSPRRRAVFSSSRSTMIFHQPILLAVVVSVVAVQAINKKSDENGGQPGNQPVYSGPGANGPYSVPNQYNPNNGPEHGAQGNLQQGSPQSNLYYYYYPVQDKQKEAQYHNANPQKIGRAHV